MILHNIRGNAMKDAGVFGFIVTVISLVTSKVLSLIATLYPLAMSKLLAVLSFFGGLSLPALQEISMYITIVVGLLTIMWYIGNMVIKEEEFRKALKNKIKRLFNKRNKQ